jgi:hypothetical protein
LKSLGYEVPSAVRKTPTSDLAFDIKDLGGNAIEIMQYTPESMSVLNYGKFLSDERVSHRILHVGFRSQDSRLLSSYLRVFRCASFGGGFHDVGRPCAWSPSRR